MTQTPPRPLFLASQSAARLAMLQSAGLTVQAHPARIDEDMITAALVAEGAKPRDIADVLAEYKAQKIAMKYPEALVLGSDQVLDLNGTLLTKPDTPDIAMDHLRAMSGQTHKLFSAAVIFDGGKPVWRHVGVVRMQMRQLSEDYIQGYVARNWDQVRHCVGAYQLEAEGARLFHRVEGDYFSVLGLPLLDVLSYLTLKGDIAG